MQYRKKPEIRQKMKKCAKPSIAQEKDLEKPGL